MCLLCLPPPPPPRQQAAHSANLKPEIRLHTFDPLYSATRLHLEDLRRRYGASTVVLNLVKQVRGLGVGRREV